MSREDFVRERIAGDKENFQLPTLWLLKRVGLKIKIELQKTIIK
jgi:hypothetical protein